MTDADEPQPQVQQHISASGKSVVNAPGWVRTFLAVTVKARESPLSPDDVALRARVRERSRSLWITDGLETQYQRDDGIRFELRFRKQPRAVHDYRWRSALQLTDLDSGEDHPEGTALSSLFSAAGKRGRLLVSGAPGAGKSTQLLELLKACLAEDEAADEHRCPVVLLLSTWRRGTNFIDWVCDQLEHIYLLPPAVTTAWLRNGTLRLLLDGLDELPLARRAERVASLDSFLAEAAHAATDVAITSRSTDYVALGHRLMLDKGVLIRPLPREVVVRELRTAGLPALASAVEANAAVRELFSAPLMVVLAILTHRSLPDELNPQEFSSAARLFELYEAAMLSRHRTAPELAPETIPVARYSSERTHEHLVYLAVLMERRSTTVLYADELTPEWLPELGEDELLPEAPRRGLFAGLVRRVGLDHASTGTTGAFLATIIGAGFILPAAVYAWGWAIGAVVGSLLGLILGMATFTLFGLARMRPFGLSLAAVLDAPDTVPRAAPRWSWIGTRALKWLPVAAVLAAITGIIIGTYRDQSAGFAAAIWVLLGNIIGIGLSPDYREPPRYPGEALRASTRILTLAFTATVVAGAVATLTVGLSRGPWLAVACSVPLSASLVMVAGPGRVWLRTRALFFGGRRSGLLPARLDDFLEHAVERTLLRRSGGGYAYLHVDIQRHFATQDARSVPSR